MELDNGNRHPSARWNGCLTSKVGLVCQKEVKNNVKGACKTKGTPFFIPCRNWYEVAHRRLVKNLPPSRPVRWLVVFALGTFKKQTLIHFACFATTTSPKLQQQQDHHHHLLTWTLDPINLLNFLRNPPHINLILCPIRTKGNPPGNMR